MGDLLTKWLRHYDPIHRGWTRSGIANAVTLTQGRSFPRGDGGYNLYCGTTRAGIDRSNPVGAAGASAAAIAPFSWIGQTPGAIYFYELAGIGPGGVESISNPTARVTVEDDGTVAAPVPPPPRDLAGAAVAGGRIKLTWTCTPTTAAARTKTFAIYGDNGTGVMDEETPIATVSARGFNDGAGAYGWTSEVLVHGTAYRFIVRAQAATGAEETNSTSVAVIADSVGPSAVAVAAAVLGEDE